VGQVGRGRRLEGGAKPPAGAKRRKEIVKNVFLVVIVLVSVQVGWQILRFASRTDVPLAYVPSKSMEPTLKVGDLVVVKGVPPEEIKEGTIIVFYVPGHYGEDEYRIVHRVVKVVNVEGEPAFETKGDNNPVSDYHRWGYIPASHVVGKVTYRLPYVGYAAIWVRRPLGVLTISLLILLLILFEFSGGKGREKHRSKRLVKKTKMVG